jgi:hypothetical protein
MIVKFHSLSFRKYILATQKKGSIAINSAMVEAYWNIGKQLLMFYLPVFSYTGYPFVMLNLSGHSEIWTGVHTAGSAGRGTDHSHHL